MNSLFQKIEFLILHQKQIEAHYYTYNNNQPLRYKPVSTHIWSKLSQISQRIQSKQRKSNKKPTHIEEISSDTDHSEKPDQEERERDLQNQNLRITQNENQGKLNRRSWMDIILVLICFDTPRLREKDARKAVHAVSTVGKFVERESVGMIYM